MANPSPNTEGLKPFQKGQSGNPGGKTAEQRRLEVEAAEMAAKLRHMMLTEILTAAQEQNALAHLSGDVLKLAKDSEDRAFGSPKQSVEHGSDPENPMPMVIPVRWHDPE